jgi:hypothetical protein
MCPTRAPRIAKHMAHQPHAGSPELGGAVQKAIRRVRPAAHRAGSASARAEHRREGLGQHSSRGGRRRPQRATAAARRNCPDGSPPPGSQAGPRRDQGKLPLDVRGQGAQQVQGPVAGQNNLCSITAGIDLRMAGSGLGGLGHRQASGARRAARRHVRRASSGAGRWPATGALPRPAPRP